MSRQTPASLAIELEDLEGRVAQARAFLGALVGPHGGSPLQKILPYLLQSQGPDGSWAEVGFPPWTDVMTANCIQVLLSAGFDEHAVWSVRPPGHRPYRGGLQEGIAFLLSERDQLGWGEDLFDTCQALKALNRVTESRSHRRTHAGYDYLVAQVEQDFRDQLASDWFGPGFYAATLETLNARGDCRAHCARLVNDVVDSQNPDDGAFAPGELSVELRVWHTAICLQALHSNGFPESDGIRRGLEWLKEVQQPETGAWGRGYSRTNSIFTAHAVMAISSFRGKEDGSVRRGVDWLVSQQRDDDGGVGGLEGSVMAAWAFTSVFPPASATAIPLSHLAEMEAVLEAQQSRIAALTAEVDELLEEREGLGVELAQEFDRYAFRLTWRRANQVALGLGVLGLGAAIAEWVW